MGKPAATWRPGEIEFEIRGEGEVVQLANSIRLLISHLKALRWNRIAGAARYLKLCRVVGSSHILERCANFFQTDAGRSAFSYFNACAQVGELSGATQVGSRSHGSAEGSDCGIACSCYVINAARHGGDIDSTQTICGVFEERHTFTAACYQ
jgi:hypothetical protein